jgi:hypothetical protein
MSRSLRRSGTSAPRDPSPAPPRSLAVPLASRPTREGRPRTALTRLEGATSLDRRSAIRIVRDLEKRGLLDARPRNVAARKAGAT